IACSQEPDTPVLESEVVADVSVDEAVLTPGEQSLADPTAEGPTRAANRDTLAAIPAAFHGIWDYQASRCDPSSDLYLKIEPRRVTFYESSGRASAIEPRADGGVSMDLAMRGEGETWEETANFRLSDDGDRLIAVGQNGPGGGQMVRKRCTG
ncbi:MAG: hypothetical protein WA948_00445, partial [Pontixanthobacter sp.]